METVGKPIEQFDATTLAPLAQIASGCADLRLEDWQVLPISGGIDPSNGILRVSGVGQAGSDLIPWSLVVKTVTRNPFNSNPQGGHYWKREAEYYRAGVLGHLPGGLHAPRCYAVVEQADGVRLFIEDLQSPSDGQNLPRGTTWPVDFYRTAARQLGCFNGAYLAGTPLPIGEWIPRNFLRAYLAEGAPNIDLFFNATDNPYLPMFYGAYTSEIVRELWDRREEMLAALDCLPQVFCHNDAFCRNLFADPSGMGDDLAAVDWSYSGIGPIGSELTPLVFASTLGPMQVSQLDHLAALALEGYLLGLADAGWHDDPDQVRFGFYANAAYRYPIAAMIGEAAPLIMNPDLHYLSKVLFNMTFEEAAKFNADANTVIYSYYLEALRLKDKLGL